MANTQTGDKDVVTIAAEIRKYMNKRPNAAETVEGVASWWLARQRFEDSLDIVKLALEYLVDQGFLEKHRTGKREIYSKIH